MNVPAATRDSSLQSWRNAEIGTVGLPNYLTQALVLDIVRERWAVVQSKALSDQLAGTALLGHTLAAGANLAVAEPAGGAVFAPIRPGAQLVAWKLPVMEAVFLAQALPKQSSKRGNHPSMPCWDLAFSLSLVPPVDLPVDPPGDRVGFLQPEGR